MPLYDCGAPDCEECQKAFGPNRSATIANYEAHERLYAIPPCRICGKRETVAVYDEKNLQNAICPECCEKGAEHADGETGHVWEYDRSERGQVCQKCGIPEHVDDGGISDRERI